MAKKGRHSIRNKRKSVKKHSHKRRSKTMRYLRGGMRGMSPQIISEHEEHLVRGPKIRESEYIECIKRCRENKNPIDAYDSDSGGGGRRRYHRRKQSKSRSKSRKH